MPIVNREAINDFIDSWHGSKVELARVAGVSRAAIYAVRNGQREPGMKFVNGMLAAGMAREELLVS